MFNVLVADDDPLIVEGLRYIVDWESLGLEIKYSAANGQQAMDYIKQNTVHIVLTDIKMPVMDGISLIQWIRNQKYDIHCIILSGYDDYPYMKKALTLDIDNYLIKSINENELLETLTNIVDKLENSNNPHHMLPDTILLENILLRWISGTISKHEFMNRLDFLGLPKVTGFYYVCVLHIRQNPDERSDIEYSYFNTLPSVDYCFEDPDMDLIFILSNEDSDQLQNSAENLTKELQNSIKIPYFLSIGSMKKGFNGVSESYKSAKHLQGYSLLSSTMTTVWQINHPENSDMVCDLSNNIKDQFYQALIHDNRTKIQTILSEIYQKEYNTDLYTADYLYTVTIKLFFAMTDAVSYLKKRMSSTSQSMDLTYKMILSMRERDQLKKWIENNIEEFFEFKPNSVNTCNPVMIRVLNYIENEYQKDISLKKISFEFNINTAYLGRLFKETTGLSFSSYINQIRIESAQKLLINTNCTVNEISNKIGYNSTNYFVNVFKKYTGYFPSQFRTLHE